MQEAKDVAALPLSFRRSTDWRFAEGSGPSAGGGRSIDVHVQVNTSAEPQKYGLLPSEAEAFLRRVRDFQSLRVRGLMTLAIFSPAQALVRAWFRRLAQLLDRFALLGSRAHRRRRTVHGDVRRLCSRYRRGLSLCTHRSGDL
ncbi:alanine racemase [Nocardioides endophyticus]|uniref:alanine racemase n=1 Tax=Nocardioides endophyticus TaxID=1353775 RepID=UPI0031EC6379